MQKLDEVGFVWSILERGSQSPTEKQELLWEKSYEKLREFYEVHGRFTVPTMLKNGKTNPLRLWITNQRKHYTECRIRKDRILKLEAIDFTWKEGIALKSQHQSQRLWDAAFHKLTKFREDKGHTFVRRDDGMALWRWTEKMNWKRKLGTLSPEREERLESIGFWDPSPPGYQERGENTEKSEEEDEEFRSNDDDDARKPPAKRRRPTSTEWSSEDDDDRKPPAKRRRTTPTEGAEEYEKEAIISNSLLGRYSVVTKVKKFFKGHGWFLGEIVSIFEDRCNVRYEDGDEETYLLKESDDLDKIIANVSSSGT
jgi:hypothetical protein